MIEGIIGYEYCKLGEHSKYHKSNHNRRAPSGVLCVIPPRKLYAAQSLVQSIDPNAFLTITQIKEVRGQGFSRERIYVESPDRHNQPQQEEKRKNYADI